MNIDTIPAELRIRPQWVAWRWERVGEKSTKVPCRAWSPGSKASSTDPSSWAPFPFAVAAWHNYKDVGGIGFVFDVSDPYVGIDYDHCIDDHGHVVPVVAAEVDLLDSYTERSPSGHGLHVIGKGSIPKGVKINQPWREVYDHERYFTMTGEVFGKHRRINTVQFFLDHLALLAGVKNNSPNPPGKNHILSVVRTSYGNLADQLGISVATVAMPDNPVSRGAGKWQGGNPWHGSTSGSNFTIDAGSNVWHCFRCDSGGDALMAIAVKHGIIRCDQAGKGCLDGRWGEVFRALEDEGYGVRQLQQQKVKKGKDLLEKMGVVR